MNTSDYTIIIVVLIFIGALIMAMSMNLTKKIFDILPNDNLKSNWKKLIVLMLIFLIGYIVVAVVVILGKTELLALLSGVIFLMGALFVFIVVRTGLDSFKKLKRLNQNLDDTQLKNKELEQFAYVTSHDLKAPLRGISSLATFIEEDFKSGETGEIYSHLSTLQGQVEHLENLINGILYYSKIGKITVESVDLKMLVAQEFKNYQNSENIFLTIKGELPIVKGDKTQLTQVFSNLISNAITHNDKKVCEVYISSIEKPKHYEIIVEDNGPGIPSKYHQKIFEVFQTLTNKEAFESTGIGLAIVKKVIEKHNGTIKIESGDKLGTKFTVVFLKSLK